MNIKTCIEAINAEAFIWWARYGERFHVINKTSRETLPPPLCGESVPVQDRQEADCRISPEQAGVCVECLHVAANRIGLRVNAGSLAVQQSGRNVVLVQNTRSVVIDHADLVETISRLLTAVSIGGQEDALVSMLRDRALAVGPVNQATQFRADFIEWVKSYGVYVDTEGDEAVATFPDGSECKFLTPVVRGGSK